ncbi:MAG: tRNA lysidine(34) synthetase TilS, partial [Rhizobiales bacterium]|nr:tRNA lysidine(34) synthetase TilS [Hyphomicrobiales bacterium]
MPAARPDPTRLFQPIATRKHVALAVSGGSDSTALLRLAAQWQGLPRFTVMTVNHGLRAESVQEARQVAEWAAEAGLPHVILHWNSPKPQTGIQAKARTARYDLMSEWCRYNDVPVLLTGHTLDDQAETVLMRLARTTSLDSLAGIHRFSRWNDTELFRPLLGEKRQDLRAYLSSVGQGWIEDPSNDDERFERVRIRKAMAGLGDIGITAEALGELAWRATEAVEGLWRATDDWVKLHVQEFETGHCTIPLEPFAGQTAALQTRILGRLISRFGAGKMPEPGELELLSAWIATGGSRRTLGGAILARRKDHL